MEKVRECSSDDQTSLPACTLAIRECTNQLTHQVSAEGQLPVSVCCRGGWFFRSYKMKQFTRHTFRTKFNINFHHFLKIGRHHSTRVSDHLQSHLPYVSFNLWQLEDMQFQFLHCLFLFFLCPNHHSGDRNLWKGGEQHVCLTTLLPSHLHAAFSWTRPFSISRQLVS